MQFVKFAMLFCRLAVTVTVCVPVFLAHFDHFMHVVSVVIAARFAWTAWSIVEVDRS